MLHHGARPCLAEMIEAYEAHGGNHIAVSPVPEEQTHLYGIVGVKDRNAKVSPITEMIEKPKTRHRPLKSAHHRALHPEPQIFELLARQERGAGGEIQLTDAMIALQKSGRHPFYAVRFDGKIYDCGSKIGFLSRTSSTRWSARTWALSSRPRSGSSSDREPSSRAAGCRAGPPRPSSSLQSSSC